MISHTNIDLICQLTFLKEQTQGNRHCHTDTDRGTDTKTDRQTNKQTLQVYFICQSVFPICEGKV